MTPTAPAVVRPRDLADALERLRVAAGDVPLRPMAGCTDVLVDLHFGKPAAPAYLDLWALRGELGGLRWTGEGLEIGALCTYADALGNARFRAELPMLAQASALVGATQIQFRGTFAGNVENGSPAADAAPALMALDARVRLMSAAGVRDIALAEYYAGYRQTQRRPDEIIGALVVPAERLGCQGQWMRKVGTRAFQAITKVGLCGVFGWRDGRLGEVRVVAVSMAAVIKRCPAIEGYLSGKAVRDLDPAALRSAQAADLRPIDDVRSTAEYRAEVFARLVEQAARETAA
ncbi:MAG: FAD binding domain-containing protein [Deltaproteobacteria bacterium]|nr:FAD binding domain-containing protein [Deltaproteobacteria bacterium]